MEMPPGDTSSSNWLHRIECVARLPDSLLLPCPPQMEGDRQPDGRLCQPDPADGIARSVIDVRQLNSTVCRGPEVQAACRLQPHN